MRISVASSLALLFALAHSAQADEAAIRKSFQERLPEFPKIDELRKMPRAGLYELRVGNEIFYSDERGEYLIAGGVLETKTKRSITDSRRNEMQAEALKTLPLSDALVTIKGNGERHLVVFADPHCGYCKKLEPEIEKLSNVTIHTFLFPILGSDSVAKSRDIWCAKNPSVAWKAWMIKGDAPAPRASSCVALAIDRNLALGRKLKVTGTPAMFFADGSTIPGAVDAMAIEKMLLKQAPKLP